MQETELMVNRDDFDAVSLDPQDESHNYTIVSNSLIRDANISPACRWLIIYLISNKPGWTIKSKQICEHTTGFMGRDAVRSVFNEAIEAGYIERIPVYKGNLRGFKYKVSSTPKFKKCFRRPEIQAPEFPEPDFPAPENTVIKEVLSKELLSSKEALINEGYPPKASFGGEAEIQPSAKVKKPKPEKIERAQFVQTTAIQHDDLVKKHGEVMVSFFYKKLSEWKIGKGIGDRPNDYRAIVNWVVNAVQADLDKGESPKNSNWEKNQDFIKQITEAFPNKTKDMYFFYKTHVLRHKGHNFDLSGDMPPEDFARLVCKHLQIEMVEQNE